MDKLKEQFAVVVKFGFWISTSLVLLVSVGIWYTAASTLDEENTSRTSKLNQAFSSINNVRSLLPTHPNPNSHAEMEEIIQARQQDVLDSWGELYKRQQDILVWPVEELKEDFVREYEGKIPIENHYDFPTKENDELESLLRTRYQRYIENVLPKLAEIAGAEWTAAFESEGSMGMAMGMASDPAGMGMGMKAGNVKISGAADEPLVQWPQANQGTLLDDLFPWRSVGVPSTLQIYYSQENLWILRQLMEIIAAVNGDAQQPYQAKIHQIDQLGIGQSVQFGEGIIALPGLGSDLAGLAAMDQFGGGNGMMDDMMMQGAFGGGKRVVIDPAENRYVDETGQPITGAKLRQALTSNQPSDVALAVAKRVPVMMALRMDQRAVPDLLAACGSAKLLIHIEQLRLLPKSGQSLDPTSADGGGMRGMAGMGADMAGGGGFSRVGMAGAQEEDFPFDMTVQIFGLIYIYNPAKREQLGMEKITEETVDEVVAKVSGQLPTPQKDEPPQVDPAAAQPGADGTGAPVAAQPDEVLPTPADPAPDQPAADNPEAPDAG